jgi:arabinofuranosyltransferase
VIVSGGGPVGSFAFYVWAAVAVLLVACWPLVRSNRWWEAAALLAVLALSGVHQALFDTLAEDAYITFRYAVNLAEGRGPVFNAGERVEGYSNFLWMVLLALPRSVADVDVVVVARVLGVACTLGSLIVLHVLVRRVTGSAPAGVLAALLTAGSGSVAAYGPSGLETPLFTLLVLGVVLAAVADRPVVAGVLAALATMTRPDGAVVAAVVWLWLMVLCRSWRDLRAPLLFAAAGLALVGPWTLWRYDYYGYLVPNALAAKSGLDFGWQLHNGWQYLLGFLDAALPLVVLVPLAVVALAAGRVECGPARSTGWLLLAIAVPYVAFFVVLGGDWMPAWRFFAPAVALLAGAIAVAWTAGRLPRFVSAGGRGTAVLGVAVCGLLMTGSVSNAYMAPRVDAWRQQVVELAELGSWMRRTLPPGTVISTYANGSLSYHAGPGLPVVDQLGLTDEHIAREGERDPRGPVGHAAHDYEYVVEVRKPAVVLLGSGFARKPGCGIPKQLDGSYVGRNFRFVGNGGAGSGEQLWAGVLLRADRSGELTARLASDPRFEFAYCP